MTNSKLWLAQGLAIATTLAILINAFGGLPPTPVRLFFAVIGVLLAGSGIRYFLGPEVGSYISPASD